MQQPEIKGEIGAEKRARDSSWRHHDIAKLHQCNLIILKFDSEAKNSFWFCFLNVWYKNITKDIIY